MRCIVLDLEMNQPSQKIIQIGAVSAHINSRTMTAQSSFNEFINPQESLSPFIIELTGIQQEQVDQAQELPDVFGRFLDWIAKEGCHITVAWGGDWNWLYQQAKQSFTARTIDLKAMYLLLHSTDVSSKQAKGLRGAMNRYGLIFRGDQHDALIDAMNTTQLLFEMMNRHVFAEEILKLAKKQSIGE